MPPIMKLMGLIPQLTGLLFPAREGSGDDVTHEAIDVLAGVEADWLHLRSVGFAHVLCEVSMHIVISSSSVIPPQAAFITSEVPSSLYVLIVSSFYCCPPIAVNVDVSTGPM